jgi:ABC-type glycerol-3-phosphate transport system substrate-binding protein
MIANDASQSRIAGKVGMAPLPAFPGHEGVATLGGWQLGINRFSQQPELAWRFVEHMTSAAAQKIGRDWLIPRVFGNRCGMPQYIGVIKSKSSQGAPL